MLGHDRVQLWGLVECRVQEQGCQKWNQYMGQGQVQGHGREQAHGMLGQGHRGLGHVGQDGQHSHCRGSHRGIGQHFFPDGGNLQHVLYPHGSRKLTTYFQMASPLGNFFHPPFLKKEVKKQS